MVNLSPGWRNHARVGSGCGRAIFPQQTWNGLTPAHRLSRNCHTRQ